MSFLNALKNKATIEQSKLVSSKKIDPVKIGSWTGKDTIPEQVAEIDRLLNGFTPSPQIEINSNFGTEDQNFYNPVDTVKIERVLNRNRIDIYFPEKPSEEIRSRLKDRGFRFDPERCAWYHKDTLLNRVFLSEHFNAQGLITSDDLDSIQGEVADDLSKSIVEEPVTASEGSEVYQQYKKQVNALIEELKIDPADLMLLAIDTLYRSTFKFN